MIDRNESLRDQIATIVQAGYSQRKTSVETADEIRSKISLLSIVTRLERENAELRRDNAQLEETLEAALQAAELHYKSAVLAYEEAQGQCVSYFYEHNTASYRKGIRDGLRNLLVAIDAAMEGDK
jgi:cell shape-determining protein MreC